MAKKVPTKPEDLERIAAELRRIADMYSHGASEMRALGIEEMMVNGLETLVTKIIPERLAANAGSVERSLRNYRASGIMPMPKSVCVDIDADAAKTRRKVARRRKKKND